MAQDLGMAQETAEALDSAAQKALELRVSELEMALDSARAKLMVRE